MSFKAIDQWFKTHLPEVAATLNPGCTDEQLSELEQLLGARLPDGFRALYKWHDGQNGDTTGIVFGLEFMPLDDVMQQWQDTKSLYAGTAAVDSSAHSSAKPGMVKPLAWSRGRIPFAHDWGGNFLGIDLDPDKQGTKGQVINFGADEFELHAFAPGVEAFFDWIAQQLSAGNFRIAVDDDGESSLDLGSSDADHFIDALKAFHGGADSA